MRNKCVLRIKHASVFRAAWWVAFAAASLVIVSSLAFGQGITGRLLGTVEDPSHAAIPGAQVTITNQNTGATWKLTSDAAGSYVAQFLPPGTYKVEARAQGFQTAVSTDNSVSVDQTTRVDITMRIGTVTQTVEVKALAPLIQSTSSSMGDVLNTQQVSQLPLNGRIFSQLVDTVPGSVPTGWGSAPESASGAGSFSPITASVNGMTWGGTTYTIDGVSNMELLNAFMNVTPPIDAIQEVKVSTNNSGADVGTYGGAQVNAYIKSGTNEFHGSLFEYLRNDALNARAWQSTTKAPFRGNQFGGSIGGPIIKNRFFFFGDYQGNRMRNGVSYLFTVPTQLMKQGYFLTSQFPQGIYNAANGQLYPTVTTAQGTAYQIPSSSFDPVSATMASGQTIWPDPNIPGAGIVNNYQQAVSEKDNLNSFDIKVDYSFANGDRVFVRESYQMRDLVAPSPGTKWIYIDDVNSTPRDHNAGIGYTHSFSPTMLNELRLGFNRFDTHHFGNDYGTNENTTLGIPNGNLALFPGAQGIANFNFTNVRGTGSPGWTGSIRLTNTYEVTDNLTWTKGRHTVKIGEDFRRLQASLTNADNNQSGSFDFNSDYTSSCAGNPACTGAVGGNDFASFLLGLPYNLNRGIVNTQPATRATLFDVYGQDDIRVNRKLTLNLALRWDVITTPVDKFNRQANFNPVDGLLFTAQQGNRHPNVANSYLDFAPRVGFAYSPDNGKTAVRGAFGITYFPDHFGAMGGTLERNYPLFEQFGVIQQQNFTPFAELSTTQNCPACYVGLPGFIPTLLTPTIVPPPNVGVYYMPSNFRPDQATMWNFGIERQLTGSSALRVSYVGTKGTHLYRGYNIQVAYPGPGPLAPRLFYYNVAPDTTSISERTSNGDSNYHSLQVQFTKSFAHGFQALLGYTWSKEIDDMSVFVPYNDKLNRGLGHSQAPDVPQNFVASYIYQLPFGTGRRWLSNAPGAVDRVFGGWQVSGITSIRSGTPLAFGVSSNLLNSNFSNRPDITCTGVGTPKTASTTGFGVQWFDQGCFANPAPYVLGNSGSGGQVRGPGVTNFDISLSKTEKLTERAAMEIRADFFNAFNTPHFSNPNTTYGSGNFGIITGTSLPPRQIQLGLHIRF